MVDYFSFFAIFHVLFLVLLFILILLHNFLCFFVATPREVCYCRFAKKIKLICI